MKKYTQKEIGMALYEKISPPKKCHDLNGKNHNCYYFDKKQGDVFSQTGQLLGVIGVDLFWN